MTIVCQFFGTPLYKECANLRKRLALSMIYINNVSNLLQSVHLSLLLLDGLVVDVLIVRHELVDGA